MFCSNLPLKHGSEFQHGLKRRVLCLRITEEQVRQGGSCHVGRNKPSSQQEQKNRTEPKVIPHVHFQCWRHSDPGVGGYQREPSCSGRVLKAHSFCSGVCWPRTRACWAQGWSGRRGSPSEPAGTGSCTGAAGPCQRPLSLCPPGNGCQNTVRPLNICKNKKAF